MSTPSRPVTDEQREAARTYVDDHAAQIRQAYGFVTLRRYDLPQAAYGIHEIKGLLVQRAPSSQTVRRACFRSEVVGLVSPLMCDEFLARMRFEQPMTSTLTWRHMPATLRDLVAAASILPIEWKDEELLASDYLDTRVRITALTPVLQFLSA